MSHHYNRNGRGSGRGPPRGYQQPAQQQQYSYQYGYQQYPGSYPYAHYGNYAPQFGTSFPPYRGQPFYPGTPAGPASKQTAKPRKKSLLQITKPTGEIIQEASTPKDEEEDEKMGASKDKGVSVEANTEATPPQPNEEAAEPVNTGTDEKAAAKTDSPTAPAALDITAVASKSTPEPVEESQSAKAKAAQKALAPLKTDDQSLEAGGEDWEIDTPNIAPDTPMTGKKYSPTEILNIRKAMSSSPRDWPRLEVVKGPAPSPRDSSRGSTPRGYQPANGGPRNQRGPQRGNGPRQNQQRNQWKRGQSAPRPGQSPRQQQPVAKLHQAKNKWSRSKHEKDKAADGLNAVKTKANSILNKLSKDNFERLVPKIVEMEINTKEQFQAITELIFEKALRMPTYCGLYAQLCGSLNAETESFCSKICKIIEEPNAETESIEYYYDVGDDEREEGREGPYTTREEARKKGHKSCTFKRILLNQCQQVFEEQASWNEAHAGPVDPSLSAAEKKAILADAEEERFKLKQRSLGIVQFVGYLYLNKLLSEKRVFVCMNELLERCEKELTQTPVVTEGVEVFAKILTEVGEQLDAGKKSHMVQVYIDNLVQITKTKGLDSRTKFMIMDVIDLRKRNWRSRRKKQEMMTKDEFEKMKVAEARKLEQQRRGGGRRGGGGGRRGHDSRHDSRSRGGDARFSR